jgi:hypothetical protein
MAIGRLEDEAPTAVTVLLKSGHARRTGHGG